MKRNVWMVQVNHSFGSNAFLPYSVGMLQAYAQSIPEIDQHYHFAGFVYLREPIPDVIKRMRRQPPDVVGMSLYIWNSQYTKALGKAIKAEFPNCLMVLGGPHVPNRSENYFKENPWADVLVHGEGEEAFAEVLQNRLKGCSYQNYCATPGLSVRTPLDSTYKTAKRDRPADIDKFPSPYLAGIFDNLMQGSYDMHASQETHRGCPYACTFLRLGKLGIHQGASIRRR